MTDVKKTASGFEDGENEQERRNYKKNSFDLPDHFDHRFKDSQGGVIGTLRVKSNSVLWRDKNCQTFHSLPLMTVAISIMKNGRKASH